MRRRAANAATCGAPRRVSKVSEVSKTEIEPMKTAPSLMVALAFLMSDCALAAEMPRGDRPVRSRRSLALFWVLFSARLTVQISPAVTKFSHLPKGHSVFD
jgi:hypothetical protein